LRPRVPCPESFWLTAVLEGTFFRLIVKRLAQGDGPKDYQWLEMSFFTRWTENTSLFICFDTPEDFQTDFLAALQACSGGKSSFLQPYALHVILMHLLVPIYDNSIWDLSARVRTIEKVCSLSIPTLACRMSTNRYLLPTRQNREHMTDTDFPGLHEVARHTAHATETVQVGGNVLERMASECEALATRQANDTDKETMYECYEALKLQHSMMLGIAARSTSNEKRLSNEINLVRLFCFLVCLTPLSSELHPARLKHLLSLRSLI
jgi:hypothetical protein